MVTFDSKVFWDTEEFMVDFCEVSVNHQHVYLLCSYAL